MKCQVRVTLIAFSFSLDRNDLKKILARIPLKFYGGYYMVARRYEFYVLVARTISHSFAALTRCSHHSNIKFIFSRHRVMFFLLCKHTDDGVFDDFPKISDHFPKISEDFPKLFRRPDERSRKFSEDVRRFPKIVEDLREDPKMFR